jgi:hypothetical protein
MSEHDNQVPTDYSDPATLELISKLRRRRVDRLTGRGDAASPITNTLMGFNHRMAPTQVPKNRERVGYTFFTRPDMHITRETARASRRIQKLVDMPMNSAQRAIIAMLDPLSEFTTMVKGNTALGLRCHPDIPFDNRQAFLPILSNRLVSLSGFPDNTLDVYLSNEGIKREQFALIDSHYAVNNAYTLNAVFQNLDKDIITELLSTWLELMSGYFDGTFIPRMRNMVQHEKNYETRIYRLLMDPTNRFVTKIGAGIAGFPVNDTLGSVMNVDTANLLTEANDQINVQFQMVGAQYLDPILVEEFNATVALFNPDMVPEDYSADVYRPSGWENLARLYPDELATFNYYGYPYIDPQTMELQWYVDVEDYHRILEETGNG